MASRDGRVITGRVVREGFEEEPDQEWLNRTPAERIEGVWSLTRLCMDWFDQQSGEPRLQRSVSRVQRPRR